jgi:hypothetical protein
MTIYFLQVLIPFINYLVVLDGDGDRLLAKYYDGRTKSEQLKNEIMLHKKTKTVAAKTDGKYHNLRRILLDESLILTFY